MRLGLVLALLAVMFAPAVRADPELAVGDTAPTFELIDQNGEKRSLDGLLEKGRTALVFYRSADW